MAESCYVNMIPVQRDPPVRQAHHLRQEHQVQGRAGGEGGEGGEGGGVRQREGCSGVGGGHGGECVGDG